MLDTISFLASLFVIGSAGAQTLPFVPDPAYTGHYVGRCAHPVPGVASDTLIELWLDRAGLIVSQPAPGVTAPDGELHPGRLWSVNFPVALLDQDLTAKDCVSIKASPSDRRTLATVCFSTTGLTGKTSAVLRPMGAGLSCGEVHLNRDRGTSPHAGRDPFAISVEKPELKLNGSLDRLVGRVRSSAPVPPPSAAAIAAYTEDPQRTLEAAAQGFLAAGPPERLERFATLRLGLTDPSPARRAHAFRQIALYAHTPLALSSIRIELSRPGGAEVLRSALDAAEGLLEPMTEDSAHRQRLRRRFVSSDLDFIFKNTGGLIDAADLAAIWAFEDSARPGGGVWSITDQPDLLEKLVRLAERTDLPSDIRARAARIALTHPVPRDEVADHVAALAHNLYAFSDRRRAATAWMRQLDYDRDHLFRDMVRGLRDQPKHAPVRGDVRGALALRHRTTVDPLAARCERALAATAQLL